jgi:hypothetical protein
MNEHGKDLAFFLHANLISPIIAVSDQANTQDIA